MAQENARGNDITRNAHAAAPAPPASSYDGFVAPRIRSLRALIIAAGIGSAVLFIIVALPYRLQEYGDGSLFSYAIAVEDVWAFHWHNISGRLFVYLAIQLPSEIYVALTHDVHAGITFYGFLFFSAPLLGLVATWAADCSKNRIFFAFACASTACFAPLVFGFPTEMWVAHAVFWPALTVCHCAPNKRSRNVLVFALLLALIFSHEAGLILAAVIVFTTFLRGTRDAALRRAGGAFLITLVAWIIVKLTLLPDDYDGPMMRRAALHFFDPSIFASYLLVLLLAALAGYGIVYIALRRLAPTAPAAPMFAASLVAAALAVYWSTFDHALHSYQRYPLRTILLMTTAGLGLLAAVYVLEATGRLKLHLPLLSNIATALRADALVHAIRGAVAVILLLHAVETAKFCAAWKNYRAAVQTLAMGTASDPALGDTGFVSSSRINPELNRLSWFSTTPYLSVLVAPGYAPARLVVDPTSTYFWLTCRTARESEQSDRAIPITSRRLIRVYACLHR